MDLLEAGYLNKPITQERLVIIARLLGALNTDGDMGEFNTGDKKYYRTSFNLGEEMDAFNITDDINKLDNQLGIFSSNINKLSIVTDNINKIDNELSITSETLNNDTQIINNLSKMINNYIIEKPIDVKLENKEYIMKDEDIPVTKVIDNITNTLDINNLNSLTENKKKIRIKKQPILINRLLNNNVRLKNLQKYVKNNKNP